ncbi:unnamed protein product [Paramecium octaurelia]|uniref:Uncharacterized protein n=1 Tax=Paramecium octaurelia TaxID=43137 RepID=A0A8S1W5H3_PAROT|nr:unnamed protein product [Paramecium octaurelia]
MILSLQNFTLDNCTLANKLRTKFRQLQTIQESASSFETGTDKIYRKHVQYLRKRGIDIFQVKKQIIEKKGLKLFCFLQAISYLELERKKLKNNFFHQEKYIKAKKNNSQLNYFKYGSSIILIRQINLQLQDVILFLCLQAQLQ